MSMTRLSRTMLPLALILGGAIILAAPAEARLPEPAVTSVIGDGLFSGVRLGPKPSAQASARHRSGVAGDNCHRPDAQARPGAAKAAHLETCK